MKKTLDSLRIGAGVALAVCAFLLAGVAWADPPGRAVRLAHLNGPVSFLAAGDNDWVQATPNRPLWTGDRLWTGSGARAELQIGGASLRLAPETSITVINFDDRIAQFEVTQGAVQFHVRTIDSGDTIEIDTPNLAYSVRQQGDYRVDVAMDGDSTSVAVLRGEADVFGAQNAYVIAAGTRYRFRGTDLTDYQPEPIALRDPLDAWASERVAVEERSQTARYVPADMIGYSDLDANGTWRNDATYGAIWAPTNVAPDWAPYRYGHWAWVDPWGWTWIDDAPWGFAPFHYGRWAFVQSRWCWVPGPRAVRPVYAPALVAFVGGNNFSVALSFGSGGGVGWFPLGPGDVYRPAYVTSREYFTRVNVTNTVVNVTNVTNIYNNPNTTNIRYVNATNTNAVTAVPTQAFVDARPVQRAAVRMNAQAVQQAQVVSHVAVAPVKASIVGAAPAAQTRPTATVLERPVIARQAPPPAPAPIAQRQEALKREPGKPLEAAEIHKLGAQSPQAQAQAPARPNVHVVQPAAAPKPMSQAAPSTDKGGPARAATPAAPAAGQPPLAGPPPKGEELRRGGPPVTTGAEKQAPPPGRAEPKAPPPTATAPGASPPPPVTTGAEKQGPPTGRPEAKGPPAQPAERGGPPPIQARPGTVPTPPGAAPTEAPGRAATGRPEAPPMTQGPSGREQAQRQGPPPKQPESAVVPPPAARAPANVPPAAQTSPPGQSRPESANISRPPPAAQGPPSRPEAANAPPRATPQPQQVPEQARRQAQPPTQPAPQGPPPSAGPPSRPPPPQQAQEQSRRQAQPPPQPAPQGPPPTAGPPSRPPPPQQAAPQQAAPQQAAPQAQGRPPDRGPPQKDKDKEKDKKDENK